MRAQRSMNERLSEKLNSVGLKIPHILLPNKNVNLSKFSVIAADQFTQSIDYWNKVKEYIGSEPSTLNLIYPEAILEKELDAGKDSFDDTLVKKIDAIRTCMDKYYNDKIYEDVGECFIYVERTTTSGVRKGIVVAVDLEKYDYNVGAKSLMRATERTVKERLVVRKQIREKASLDLPHILVLINDKNNIVFNEVNSVKKDLVYDFNLMKDSGNIKGYKIQDELSIERIVDKLCELKNNAKDGFLYAVGDGNHSLAAAKDSYEKTGKGRYALVELVNIHDKALLFLPIHRVVMGMNKNDFEKETGIDVKNPPPLQDLQKILDEKNYKIDYIHGKSECEELSKNGNNVSIVYDKFSYETLFDDVIKHGSLCRKSFSMGEAKDKRFYLEAQRIE